MYPEARFEKGLRPANGTTPFCWNTPGGRRAVKGGARWTDRPSLQSGLRPLRPDGAGHHQPAAGRVERTMSTEAIAIVGAAVGLLGVLVPLLLTLGRRIDALAADLSRDTHRVARRCSGGAP